MFHILKTMLQTILKYDGLVNLFLFLHPGILHLNLSLFSTLNSKVSIYWIVVVSHKHSTLSTLIYRLIFLHNILVSIEGSFLIIANIILFNHILHASSGLSASIMYKEKGNLYSLRSYLSNSKYRSKRSIDIL